MEMSIRTFSVPGSVESIAKAWLLRVPADSSRTVHTYAEGRRVIIGRLTGGVSETVTFRPSRDTDHTQVVVAQYDLRTAVKRSPLPPVVLPPSHVVMSVIEWSGAERLNLYQIHSRSTPAEATRVLEERLRLGGWTLEASHARVSMTAAEGAWWASRGSEQLAISVSTYGQQGSRIVMQWRRTDEKT